MMTEDTVKKSVFGAVLALACAYWMLKDTDWWLVNVRYADADSIVLEPKPIDCERETAPEGEKGCHYVRHILEEKQGNRLTKVYGTWERIQDNQQPTVVNRTAPAPARTDSQAIADCINRNYDLRTSQSQNQMITDRCAKDVTFTLTPVQAGDDDCYDSNGNLTPNEFSAFGGSLDSCAPGQTRKPRSERAHVPAAWRAWVEQWEACEKAVVDNKHATKEAFDTCRATAEASRPKNPAPQTK